ncbi:MAG: hypothetical protein Unbinned5081contig1002_23 [Prokaryotic dsDNA virus sp.]|nr:MAG: hypothetical protein Unbinned5081contig1002_23 [Prokaryotic dsDNA virus sp.]
MTYIMNNPDCSAKEMAENFKVSNESIRKQMRKLIKQQHPNLHTKLSNCQYGRPSVLYSVKFPDLD